jgi:hypothetical protein
MDKSSKEHWKNDPEDHDFPAAVDYLSLLLDPDTARSTASSLRHATGTTRKAKDLLRASGLRLLPPDNAHVAADLDKVKQGDRLSPVLLVRGRLRNGLPLTIADGYHRVCASYHLDEDADIPCRIVDVP